MSTDGGPIEQAIAKRDALRQRGVDPYGRRFGVTHWAGTLHEQYDAADEATLKSAPPVRVAGRILLLRRQG